MARSEFAVQFCTVYSESMKRQRDTGATPPVRKQEPITWASLLPSVESGPETEPEPLAIETPPPLTPQQNFFSWGLRLTKLQ